MSSRADATAKVVHQHTGNAPSGDTGCVNIIDYVSMGGATVTNGTDTGNRTTTSLTFNFKDMIPGQSFSFVSSGFLCNEDRVPMGEDDQVICTLVALGSETTVLGTTSRYQVQVTWRGQVIASSAIMTIVTNVNGGGGG